MAEVRFLLVRLGSLGDIVNALPAASALRAAHPGAEIDWVVESKWKALLEDHPALSSVQLLERTPWRAYLDCAGRLRRRAYLFAIDFQGLFKSAGLAWLSRAPLRIGFDSRSAREAGAAWLYTVRVPAEGAHVVEQNMSLAARFRAIRSARPDFGIKVSPQAEDFIGAQLHASGLREFYVISPGGGWRSKCWPAERYGHLHRQLAEKYGWRAVVNFGPNEWALVQEVAKAADQPAPILLPMDVSQLMAAIRRAKFVLAADTGPLHLAVALNTPAVGLYGPTNPQRNGPYNPGDIVVDQARPEERTYKRGKDHSPAMLRISVAQVMEAIERRLAIRP